MVDQPTIINRNIPISKSFLVLRINGIFLNLSYLEINFISDFFETNSFYVFHFLDHDTHMIYIAGKGDGNVRYYELLNEEPYVFYLSQVRNIWFFSHLIPSRDKCMLILLSLYIFWGKCVYFSIFWTVKFKIMVFLWHNCEFYHSKIEM